MEKYDSSINYITIAKAIGILLVVCGHVGGVYKFIGIPLYTTNPSEIFPLYSYHMPLFIFLSGYFYKSEYVDNIKTLINKRVKSLVIPYYKWNLFYGVFVTLLIVFGIFKNAQAINLYNLLIEPFFGGYQYNLNGPSWFLLSLFLMQVGYTLMRKFMKNKSFKRETIFTACLFVLILLINVWSNSIEMKNNPIPLLISRTIFGIFFFHLGYYFRTYIKDRFDFSFKTLSIIIVVKILLNELLGRSYTLSMRTMILRGENMVPIIWAILGILYILNISKLLEGLLNKEGLLKAKEVFNYVGKNTFAIMMHHMTISLFLGPTLDLLSKHHAKLIFWNNSEPIIKPIICVVGAIYFDKYVGKYLEKVYSKVKEKLQFNKIREMKSAYN